MDDESKSWGRVFSVFCETTTFHGLRNIAESTSNVSRRIIWITIVIITSSVFVSQCQDLVRLHLSRPVRMTMSMSHQSPVVFPAVTICNQNAFRVVATADNDSYGFLNDMYSGTNMYTFNHTKWNVSKVSMSDVFLQFAHRKQDMIASCRWKGRPCSHDDFQLTVTDAGVCYTFNSRISPNSSVDASGVKHGLQLVLNVEQYEYMRGPHNAVGLKFLLHRQDDVPLVQDFGENIPASMNTFVAVTITNVNTANKHTYIHTYTHTYIHTYAHTYIHTYIHNV
ncbi:hypothetical protein NP493_182g00013 [Ridgeia piscesae]|uniref:Uncharacterized protein n=1 Tax=Ridgeia piscesae TaxID=27915 RepID=A0AAD9P2F2_RIDPI|nr:hypothetical protein NP493_182g00013 [Ridgeia piscesae]